MKRVLAFVMMTMLVFALAGCGSKGGAGQSAMEALPEDATPAQVVVADFTDKVNADASVSLEDLANGLVTAEHMAFQGASMAVEPGYLNGFTEEINGFAEGYMFGPTIGSIPFIGYVFTLEEGTDADAYVEGLKRAADLRWNICTQADDMQVGVVGDKVCFVMSPASFEE